MTEGAYGHLEVLKNKASLAWLTMCPSPPAQRNCFRVPPPLDCYRITSNITELGAYGHLEVLKNKATLAQIREVIREISSTPDQPLPGGGAGVSPPRLPQWPSSGDEDQLGDEANGGDEDYYV